LRTFERRLKTLLLLAVSINFAVAAVPSSCVQAADESGSVDEAQRQSDAVTHFNLAGFYFHNWKLPLAEVELEESIAYYPDFKAAHRDLCLVSFCEGNILRSLAELMMTVGLGDPVPLTEKERTALNEKAMKLHYGRGLDQGGKQKWNDAIAEFRWALTYEPEDARVRRSLAFAYANIGNFALAEQQYAQSFGLDPADPYGHADFANVLADNGEKDRAMKQMSEALKRAPNAAALHVDMGWMAEASGDLQTADDEFSQAVRLSPQHAGLWAHLGHIFESEGKSDQALEAYEKALALDPEIDDVRARLLKLKQVVHPTES
jgi:Flp pilus assembly protein TadD